jgi:hypothetical protein
VTAVGCLVAALGATASAATADSADPFATVTITAGVGVHEQRIPHSFFGLSTEYWTLPDDELHTGLYTRVLSMLHVPGDGRYILRIGGDSTSRTFYDPQVHQPPRWAYELTPQFITQTAALVKSMHIRVILDLNLITSNPELAGAWAKIAYATFPPGSIVGFEIGNEPDLYHRAFWVFATGGEDLSGDQLPAGITPDSYARDYRAYAAVLRRLVPQVPLVAPALADPTTHIDWIRTLLDGPHPDLGLVSGHRYPYATCSLPGSPVYPTIARILSEQATAGTARGVEPAIRLAHRHGLPFRLTEINSVTCGGTRGVSDAFATALWAPDAAFEYVRAGARGVNLHARVTSVNDPLTFDHHGLIAHPLLYGMILFARTLGPDARLLIPHVRHAPSSLKVWAVSISQNRTHVLLINKGPRARQVLLGLPAHGEATVQRLLAPGPAALIGETLGGQRLNHNARWVGDAERETIPHGHGGYLVPLPAYSAALVSLHGSKLR